MSDMLSNAMLMAVIEKKGPQSVVALIRQGDLQWVNLTYGLHPSEGHVMRAKNWPT